MTNIITCKVVRGLLYLAMTAGICHCVSHPAAPKFTAPPPPTFQPTVAQSIALKVDPPVLTLHDVGNNHLRLHFSVNSFLLDAKNTALLNRFVVGIASLPFHHIRIEGFCDPSGSPRHNSQLGWQRIHTVAQFIVEKGIRMSALQLRYGGVPHHLNSRHSQWTEERRVDIFLVP